MFRTAEYVSPLHPDKICDRISDGIVDQCIAQDPNSRCAIEVMGGHGIITVTGELTTKAFVDIPELIHAVLPSFRGGVQVNLVRQSPEIACGVDQGGAGDQGIMVGYACDETLDYMPLEHWLARDLCFHLFERWDCDGKVQVTTFAGRIHTVVVSWADVDHDDLTELVMDWLKEQGETKIENLLINPGGRWFSSGFDADTGLTGRKIVMDAYGPRVPVGGGAFSGKDGTKVDRSGAYKARQIAIEVLKAGIEPGWERPSNLGLEVLVKMAYSIGRTYPIEVSAQLFKHGNQYKTITFDEQDPQFQPEEIIKELGLLLPCFAPTAKNGHFGNGNVWDLTSPAETLKVKKSSL